MADNYQDYTIRRQILLERLKSGEFKKFSAVFDDIEKLIKQIFLDLDGELRDMSRTKLEKLISSLRVDQGVAFSEALNKFTLSLSAVGQLAMADELQGLEKYVDLRDTKLGKFTKPDLHRKILQRPLSVNGQLLEQYTKDFTRNENKRVGDVVRLAWAEGETNQQAVRRIIGTKANRFKDGILNVSRNHASTVVRTSIQHVASAARYEIWKNNPTVVRGYEWLSTLDRKTSRQCQVLDGKKFEFGKGPVPPVHPNCRSTTVPLTNPKYDFLDEGATRSAEFGPVSAKDDYFDWLKRQDRGIVEEALGKKRAAVFLDGGLTKEQFKKLQFDKNFTPLSLEDMQKKSPAAFKKAFGEDFVDPNPAPVVKPNVPEQSIREKVANRMPEGVTFEDGKLTSVRLKDLREELKQDFLTTGNANISSDLYQKIQLESQRIKQAMDDANAQAHSDMVLSADKRGSARSIFGEVSNSAKKHLRKIGEATRWMTLMIKKDLLPQGVKVDTTRKSRSFYYNPYKSIYLSANEKVGVIIHEFVHNIEYAHPDISKKTKAFVEKRGEGEKIQSLKKLTGANYKRNEVAYEDKWVEKGGSVYSGKVNADRPSTELLTMGMERLFENPVLFAQQDPEYFDFVIGLVQ